MEQPVKDLANRIVERYKNLPYGQRILVGVAGVPGAGKSTLAFPLTELVNELLGTPTSKNHHLHVDKAQGLVSQDSDNDGSDKGQLAVSVSLDGWHTTRAELDKMPDPKEARRRRGAAFTFDADDWVAFIRSLRKSPPPPSIQYRTFDHAKKDPEPAPHPILPSHRIVIVEGLYVLLSTEPWKDSVALLDERIWVDCPNEVARSRLVERHLQTGIEPDRTSAEQRVDGSDMHNAQFIRDNLTEPTAVVHSILDPEYVKAVEERFMR